MIKLTVLYGHPADAVAFEDYYHHSHLPIASTLTGMEKVEYTKFLSDSGGNTPAFYRMAEFWFNSAQELETTMQSPEGVATAADLANFATGGVTMIVGEVDDNKS